MENFQNKPRMSADELSVVLAVYNGERYLRKLLDSVLVQTGVDIKEFVIVDDRSTDTSGEIIKAYQQKHSNIKAVANEVNLGPIRSFIKGAKLTTTDYIAFADQDDIWKDDKLSLSLGLLKKIDTENKPAVVFTDLEMIDEEGKHLRDSFWKLYHIDPAKNNFFTVLFGNIATGCTMVINKKMKDEFIDMPANAQMHDHWMALIALSIGNWGYLTERTVKYRVHGNSVTDKNGVPIKTAINNFLSASFSRKSKFLEDYIDQAVLFRAKYSDKLGEYAQRHLNYFINLKNASGFKKKMNSKFRFLIDKWI